MRLKQAITFEFRKYLEHPCAVPNCSCIVHRLGVPQADVVVEVMRRFTSGPKSMGARAS
jgi:hypothetical protein